MKSDKSVIVLLLMLSLTEALPNETYTYFQSRKILRLQFPNKSEATGIVETTDTSEKENRTCIKREFICKESCFLTKRDLAKRDNSSLFDFHYRVDGEHYKYEYSNIGFTFTNSSKNEINCQVSVEIYGKHLSGHSSAVVSRRKFLNGNGYGYSSTRTTKFKDSKDFESSKISTKRRVSDSVRRISADLRENRYKRRITVLNKYNKDRNIMAVRSHHEKMKTISTSCFRMRLDRRMPANVRNQNEDGPLKIISHLRRKVPKEVVDMSRTRNLQIRTQVSVLLDSRKEKSDESKDTSYRTVSPVIYDARYENKEISLNRIFQLRSQVKANDNLKRRIFQPSTKIRGDSQKKMLLLSNEVGEFSQRRIFKLRKEARVSRERNISKMRNEFINEIEAIRQKGIGQVRNEVMKIVKWRSQRIFQSKHELRNAISSARTSNVEIKKDVDRRLGTTHFNEAKSKFERKVNSNYFHREKENIISSISDSEDDATNELMIEGRNSAHINVSLNERKTRLSNTRDRRQLIRNRSEYPFIARSAIKSRMLKRDRISRVGMRKRKSTGMSFDNRYFVKRKSFVDIRYETVRELARNNKIIKFKNLASRENMINQLKERRRRKDTTRNSGNSESLIYHRQFSSMLNFSELSNTEFRNVAKIILDTHCSSKRFSTITEQETYLGDNSTAANSLSTSTKRHVNIVALSAGKFEKTPISISCCRLIKNLESESHANSVDNKRLLNLSNSDINKWSRLTDTNQHHPEFAGLIPVTRMQQDGNLITSLGLAMASLY